MAFQPKNSLAVLEISALGAAIVILDRAEKAARVSLLQAELNDYYGFVLKLLGKPAALRSAVDSAESLAKEMGAKCVTSIIDAPDQRAWKAIESPPEHQPLIEQNVVYLPRSADSGPRMPLGESPIKERSMATEPSYAIGLIETQGFTAVIEAIDTACKAANVEIIGKEKLGGGYITILIKGDVAAVSAAVEAGKTRVDGLGNLIAAHVIPRPSAAILSILPNQ